jgi:hypothetical protein
MKQTPVEWLVEEMSKTYIFNQDDFDMFKHAKKIEKEEQEKNKFSEEDIINALHSVELKDNKDYSKIYNGMKEWFEQFKKK